MISELPFPGVCIYISYKKYHSLQGIFEKVHITVKFQKTEFDENATSGVSAFSIISIYLIQFIMDQNWHNSCYKQAAGLKISY